MLVRRVYSWKKLGIVVALFGAAFLLAIQNPVVKNRIFKVNRTGNFFSGTSLRTNIWKSALGVKDANLLWGSGEEQANSLLVEQYKSKKLLTPVKYKYHAHSLFLQTLVQYGLLGLLIITLLLCRPLLRAKRDRNILLLFWMVLFILTSITESVFNRQWGILSFTFITGILLVMGSLDNSNRHSHNGLE